MRGWLRVFADAVMWLVFLGVSLTLFFVLAAVLDVAYSMPLELQADQYDGVIYDLGGVEMVALTAAGVAAGASALSAGTQLAGAAGLFGSNRGPDRDPWGRYWRDFAESVRRHDRAVRIRVDDAKKAGVHPLFALGYQGGGYNPPFMGTGESGSLAGRVTSGVAGASRELRGLAEMQMRANIYKTEMEAHLARSQAKSAEVQANAVQDQHVGYVARNPTLQPVAPVKPARGIVPDLMSSRGPLVVQEPEEVVAGKMVQGPRDMIISYRKWRALMKAQGWLKEQYKPRIRKRKAKKYRRFRSIPPGLGY